MECPRCGKGVPDESTFCLHCGAALVPPPRVTPSNGGGKAPTAAAPGPGAGPAPGQKHPYALSFRALSDERLRYRVARWVCDLASAHALAEVQDDLARGEFATFVALTPEEAEQARQKVQALGVHPALVRLELATQAEMLLPRRTRTEGKGSSWTPAQKFAAVAVFILVLLVFGIVVLYKYG